MDFRLSSNKVLFIDLWSFQGTYELIPVPERNEENKRKENKVKRTKNGLEITKYNTNESVKTQLIAI